MLSPSGLPVQAQFWPAFSLTRQQAEVVLLQRDLAAAGLEFALGAVPVQDEVGRRRAGK